MSTGCHASAGSEKTESSSMSLSLSLAPAALEWFRELRGYPSPIPSAAPSTTTISPPRPLTEELRRRQQNQESEFSLTLMRMDSFTGRGCLQDKWPVWTKFIAEETTVVSHPLQVSTKSA